MQEKLDLTYSDAVQAIKQAILSSQLRATRHVNEEQLALYFGIGKYISENTREGKWGTGAVDSISRQLRAELPGLKGYSGTNLKYMRLFYEAWTGLDNSSAVAAEIEEEKTSAVADELQPADNQSLMSANIAKQNHPFPEYEMTWDDFFTLGFTLHMEILSKAKTTEERAFYIHQAALYHWDKYTLRDYLKADIFHHQTKLPNNFATTIPATRQAMKAMRMFKDEYMLDFINVEQLGERDEDIDEAVIEKEIVNNIKNFIIQFGRSFTYKGSQVYYDKLGHDHWVDLLFFNRELQSLVVVELKSGKFKPAYLGQLAAYLRVLDDEEKLPNENPSIGIILCKDADKAYVEYVLQDYNKPMGVATYKTRQEQLKELLPDEEKLKELL
jgi:predicted nuclease of restriction endonuclease-like (RecB) superfamily